MLAEFWEFQDGHRYDHVLRDVVVCLQFCAAVVDTRDVSGRSFRLRMAAFCALHYPLRGHTHNYVHTSMPAHTYFTSI